MIQTKLRDKTLELLINRPRSLTFESISKFTSLKVDWIKAFQNGKIEDPSVNKTETLYEFLINKKLKL